MHTVRMQRNVLYVSNYSNPSFGPLGEHLTRQAQRGDSAFWPS